MVQILQVLRINIHKDVFKHTRKEREKATINLPVIADDCSWRSWSSYLLICFQIPQNSIAMLYISYPVQTTLNQTIQQI